MKKEIKKQFTLKILKVDSLNEIQRIYFFHYISYFTFHRLPFIWIFKIAWLRGRTPMKLGKPWITFPSKYFNKLCIVWYTVLDYLPYVSTQPLRNELGARQEVQPEWIQNFLFCFGCLTKAEEPWLPNYLPIARKNKSIYAVSKVISAKWNSLVHYLNSGLLVHFSRI